MLFIFIVISARKDPLIRSCFGIIWCAMSQVVPKLLILLLMVSAGLAFNWTTYHSNFEIGLIFSEISKKCRSISFFYNLRTHDTDETVNGNKLYVLGFGQPPFLHKLGIVCLGFNCFLVSHFVFHFLTFTCPTNPD